MEDKPLVSICCLVYNHESYLRDCFEGFVKQKTTFPIEILIHDDASTDYSADIIREYTAKYPDLFKPIYQTENQYSKGVKISFEYQYPRVQGKYIALCEGDDYWIDPNKLQMQVDWLESHPDYSMCCSDAVIKSPEGILDWHRYETDCDIPAKDMILGGGIFVQTCTILFRKQMLTNYPSCCKECHVGDFPLQVWLALNGKVRYLSKKMGSYNLNHPGSWTDKQQKNMAKLVNGWKSEMNMLDGLNRLFNYYYNNHIHHYKVQFLFNHLILYSKHQQFILERFQELVKSFSEEERIQYIFIRLKLFRCAKKYYLFTQKGWKALLLSTPIINKTIVLLYCITAKVKSLLSPNTP